MITAATRDNYEFVSLANCKREKFQDVKRVYTECMEPFYGQQKDILADIEKRDTRKTEILTHGSKDVGVVVYKRDLTRTFAQQELDQCLEVSLVSVFNKEDENKGYRSKLFDRIHEVAKEMRASSVACKLAAGQKDQIEYFKHKGYQIIQLASGGKVDEVVAAKILEQKRRKVEEPQQEAKVKAYEVTLKEPYLSAIMNGTKTIEGRINSGQFAKYCVGDQVVFFNNKARVQCTVTKIEKFVGFREMLDATDYKKCIPNANSLDTAFDAYKSINGFLQRAKQSGVLALHITVNK